MSVFGSMKARSGMLNKSCQPVRNRCHKWLLQHFHTLFHLEWQLGRWLGMDFHNLKQSKQGLLASLKYTVYQSVINSPRCVNNRIVCKKYNRSSKYWVVTLDITCRITVPSGCCTCQRRVTIQGVSLITGNGRQLAFCCSRNRYSFAIDGWCTVAICKERTRVLVASFV